MEFHKPLCLFFVLFTLFSISQANKFYVGGNDGWVPNPSESYNQWAGRRRFQVNDTLVFKYTKGSDSVLEVKKEDYDKCNKTNAIKKFEEGDTEFKLDRPGPFYFISGKDGSCEKGQKLIVVVLSPRGSTQTPPPSSTPVVPSPTSPPKSSPSPSVPPSISPPAMPPTSISPSPAGISPSPMSTPPASGPTASSPSPVATSPSPMSTPPSHGPSSSSPSPAATSPTPSPMSTPPAPSPGSSMGPTTPSTGGPPAPSPGTTPSPSSPLSPVPGTNPSPGSSNATAPPQGNSGSSVSLSMFLVYSVTVVVGAVLLCYDTVLG